MFTHHGPARSARQNALLAGYLALVAGFVNSGGFVLIGSFTSHVTGSVGRLANDVATREEDAAIFAGLLVLAFFAGAFLATLILESAVAKTSRAYAAALFTEGCLLALFIFVAGLSHSLHARVLDSEAGILCLAMGMQNSLVTRLSGAVVRTTHLTGVVTDLGIESAHWYRWHRAKLHVGPVPRWRSPPTQPRVERTVLLLTITLAFTAGGVMGALLTARWSRWAMLFPAVAILAASLYALLVESAEGQPSDRRGDSGVAGQHGSAAAQRQP